MVPMSCASSGSAGFASQLAAAQAAQAAQAVQAAAGKMAPALLNQPSPTPRSSSYMMVSSVFFLFLFFLK